MQDCRDVSPLCLRLDSSQQEQGRGYSRFCRRRARWATSVGARRRSTAARWFSSQHWRVLCKQSCAAVLRRTVVVQATAATGVILRSRDATAGTRMWPVRVRAFCGSRDELQQLGPFPELDRRNAQGSSFERRDGIWGVLLGSDLFDVAQIESVAAQLQAPICGGGEVVPVALKQGVFPAGPAGAGAYQVGF